MCTQAGFQAKTCQLPWIEECRDITHLAQSVIECAAQGAALGLHIAWQPPLQPLQLQFGSGQQLAYVVMQFAAQVLAFAFLDFEHALGQFCRAQAYRPGTLAQVPADPEHCHQL
ncbi:hypothetical protein D3C76_1491860 [compost metagenome]